MLKKLAFIVLLGGFAAAEPALQLGIPPLQMRIAETTRAVPAANIVAEFGPIVPQRVVTVGSGLQEAVSVGGKMVKWGGGVLIGAALVKAAIDYGIADPLNKYFNEQFKRWWNNSPADEFVPSKDFISSLGYDTSVYERVCRVDTDEGVVVYTKIKLPSGGIDYIGSLKTYKGDERYWRNYDPPKCGPARAKNLDDYIAQHPEAAESIKNSLGDYIATQPEALPMLLPKLTPRPNVNQIADDVVDPNLDTDGDGYTDGKEKAEGSDLNDPQSKPKGEPDAKPQEKPQDKPEDKPEDKPQDKPEEKPEDDKAKKCDVAGRVWDDVNETCGGKKEDEEKKEKDKNVENECGIFTVARFLKFPGDFIKDVIFPCEDLGDFIEPIASAASSKFPFSLTNSLDKIVTYGGNGDRSAMLPEKLGPFTLDWSFIGTLVAVVGLLFKAVISWFGIDAIVSRLTGQLVIK